MFLLDMPLRVRKQLLLGFTFTHQAALAIDDLWHDSLLSIGGVSGSHLPFRQVVAAGTSVVSPGRGPAQKPLIGAWISWAGAVPSSSRNNILSPS